jgi:hypothetical protein
MKSEPARCERAKLSPSYEGLVKAGESKGIHAAPKGRLIPNFEQSSISGNTTIKPEIRGDETIRHLASCCVPGTYIA